MKTGLMNYLHKTAAVLFLAIYILSCSTPAEPEPDDPEWPDDLPTTGLPPEENDFIHVSGANLEDMHGNTFFPKGIAFTNHVYSWEQSGPDWKPGATHHSEHDYARVRELGFNCVRFLLNYHFFEDDSLPYEYKESGFDWLDQNIGWARDAGVLLLLNMHFPQGGYQSLGEGSAIWEHRALRERFIALWQEIARRYAGEPVILGYGLMNEPNCTRGIYQWERLAKKTTAAIRAVDQKHIISVERVSAVLSSDSWVENWEFNRNGNMNFFLVNDTNILYEFHQYLPLEFTAQGTNSFPGIGTQSPDYPGWFNDFEGTMTYADREYIDALAVPLLDFAERNGVALFMGEFGAYRQCFEGSHNGTGWVSNMIDFANDYNIGLCYHTYHEPAYGLYQSSVDVLPQDEDINEELAQLFRDKLGLVETGE